MPFTPQHPATPSTATRPSAPHGCSRRLRARCWLGLRLRRRLGGVAGSTVPFALALSLLLAAIGAGVLLRDKPDAAQLGFALLLALVALSLVIGLDFFRVEGDIDRLNSIFKFYLQVWVMLGIASAYLLWRLFRARSSALSRIASVRQAWQVALAVLLISAAIYPALGTQDRLRDRFEAMLRR